MLVPQGAPFCTLPVAPQVSAPVAHEVTPVAQGFDGGVHDWPAVHDTQLPALHTRFCPHDVPSAALLPVSLQATPASPQMSDPTLHGADSGTQGDPLAHA